MSTQIDLDALMLDEDLQPREKIDGATRWLADGYHRWHAHKALGPAEIAADVRLGSKKDALLHSLSANAEHGKQRGYGDYQKAYKIIKAHELCEPWDTKRVHELIRCTVNWAEKLTQSARTRKRRKDTAAMVAGKAAGKSTREIADELGVDQSTVVRRLADAKTDNPEMHHPEQELDLEPPPERRERLGYEWVDWTGPIRRLAELDADLEKLAGKLPSLRPKLLAEARAAQARLTQWIEYLEKLNDEVPEAA